MQEHSFQARKRRPLETQENIVGPTAGAASTGKVDQDFHDEIGNLIRNYSIPVLIDFSYNQI